MLSAETQAFSVLFDWIKSGIFFWIPCMGYMSVHGSILKSSECKNPAKIIKIQWILAVPAYIHV